MKLNLNHMCCKSTMFQIRVGDYENYNSAGIQLFFMQFLLSFLYNHMEENNFDNPFYISNRLTLVEHMADLISLS